MTRNRRAAISLLTLFNSGAVLAFNSFSLQARISNDQATCLKVAIPLVDENGKDIVNTQLSDESAWVKNLDYDAFARDVNKLGKQLKKEQGVEDVEHLNKILRWRDIAAIAGITTMWMSPNPLSVLALSTWTYASWTMVAHHTCHGGYNRVDAGKFNSRGFAIGSWKKRIEDWCDWMMPEAWNIEHNRLHHYHLGEEQDPDLVQRNLEFLREMKIPMPLKYAVVGGLIPIWKWFYYAPNTFKELQIAKWKKAGKTLPKDFKAEDAITVSNMLFPQNSVQRAASKVADPKVFFSTVLAPFFVSRFLLLPAPLLLVPQIGASLFGNAIINLILAELVTNIHAFITIVTNHAGEDIYTFEGAVKPASGAFYVRQITGSANYQAGNDLVDFSHGWLNYQIEHHVWPDLSMLQYQRGAPKLKEICESHGVPYVQESVFERLRKTVDIMVGKSTMRVYPVDLEPAKDKSAQVTWKSTNGAIDDEV